jgi:hypothetical protein
MWERRRREEERRVLLQQQLHHHKPSYFNLFSEAPLLYPRTLPSTSCDSELQILGLGVRGGHLRPLTGRLREGADACVKGGV